MIESFDNKFAGTAIIGAGAAGLMAAATIKSKPVVVFERNEKPGKKLYISGKGRCNVTNNCSPEDFLSNVVEGGKFLQSSLHGFTPYDTQAFLQSEGVPTKVERGNRVFPCSDKSSDVIKAFYECAKANGAQFRFDERVQKISREEGGYAVCTASGTYYFENVLIATGGKSYSATGSTGDGYKFVEAFGHTVVTPVPSLVPFVTEQDVTALAGLTLRNVAASVKCGKKTEREFGEMLFTHKGLSGPIILRLSAKLHRAPFPYKLYIDMKPALDEETLCKRLQNDFTENSNKQLKNALDSLLPKAMIMPILQRSGLSLEKRVNIITREERTLLARTIKNVEYDVTGTEGFDSAVVTSGGVDVREVNPKTMESKLNKGLYFAGELLNIDALTGGFNIQIALSTAYAAAKAIDGGNNYV